LEKEIVVLNEISYLPVHNHRSCAWRAHRDIASAPLAAGCV